MYDVHLKSAELQDYSIIFSFDSLHILTQKNHINGDEI